MVLTGTGFNGTECVKFGGVAASNVKLLTPTTLQVTVPPHATGPAVDVTVTQNLVTSILPASFTYWPAPTNVLASSGFEGGNLQPFTTISKQLAIVTTKAHTGTHSVYTAALYNATNNQLNWQHSQDDIVGGPGRYHRWYMLIPAATLANTAKTGQIKLFLSRTGVSYGFVTLGEGLEFNSNDNQLASRVDYQSLIMHTGPSITPDVWHEIQVYEYRDPGAHVGTARVWWDGKLVGQRTIEFLGDDDPKVIRAAEFGAVYTQHAIGYPVEVYVDDVVIANGYIDPVP